MHKVIMAGVLGPLLLACSSNGESTSATGSNDGRSPAATPVTLGEFLSELETMSCEYYERCAGYTPKTGCGGDPLFALEELGVDESMIVYHAEQGEACLHELRSAFDECTPSVSLNSEVCRTVLEGKGGNGDPCTSQWGCEYAMFCDTQTQCPGACTPKAVEGEDCRVVECLSHLDCKNDVCTVLEQVGEACEEDTDCESQLDCLDGTCQAITPFTSQLGETCASSLDCFGVNHCDPTTLTCVPAAKSGEACGVKPCELDLRCINSLCQAVKGDGDACEADAECESLRCDAGKCSARSDIGQPCADTGDCQSFQCGTQGRCVTFGSCE